MDKEGMRWYTLKKRTEEPYVSEDEKGGAAAARKRRFGNLKNGKTGVLAVLGDEGYPYAVPLNYALVGDCIYFHCARDGHKTDALGRNSKVSFCVVEKDTVIPQIFSTDYRSAVVFGQAQIVEGRRCEARGASCPCGEVRPGYREDGAKEIEAEWSRSQLWRSGLST